MVREQTSDKHGSMSAKGQKQTSKSFAYTALANFTPALDVGFVELSR